MKEFENKTILITGAAKGQGRACAKEFAKQGANIIAFDLKQKIEYPCYNNTCKSDMETLKEEIEINGGNILLCFGDVRNETEVQNAVKEGWEKYGRIDILFNNAGICAYANADEMTEKEWDAMMDINCKGAFLFCKHCIPFMKKQNKGVIINNSSIAGLRGMNRLSHYAASKWAMVGLTKSLAIELAPFNIRVVSIHPTGVNTPMNDGLAAMENLTPQQVAERSAGNLINVPWIEVEDVVNSLLFLASDKSRFITGSQFVLDAGLLSR